MLGKMEWFEHPAESFRTASSPRPSSQDAVAQRATVRMEELQSPMRRRPARPTCATSASA
jgi:hypothetical protein